MFGHGGDFATRIGITAAEIAACAHEHVNDGFEFLVAEIYDGAGQTGALEDADIGRGNIVEMLLVAARREELGLVEDAQELRHLADEFKEGAEAFDLLPGGIR